MGFKALKKNGLNSMLSIARRYVPKEKINI